MLVYKINWFEICTTITTTTMRYCVSCYDLVPIDWFGCFCTSCKTNGMITFIICFVFFLLFIFFLLLMWSFCLFTSNWHWNQVQSTHIIMWIVHANMCYGMCIILYTHTQTHTYIHTYIQPHNRSEIKRIKERITKAKEERWIINSHVIKQPNTYDTQRPQSN